MKQLPLKSLQYQTLEVSYRLYLEILGYAPSTLRLWPVHVREWLHYLEAQGITHIDAVQGKHVQAFTRYLTTRPHQKRPGKALSSNSINIIISALAVFMRYLHHSGRHIEGWTLQREPPSGVHPVILTALDIRRLYDSTFAPYRENTLAMGQRDRVILAVLYGCGLRRMEAVQLDVDDIDLGRRVLFVRSGKGNKQRYVPIA